MELIPIKLSVTNCFLIKTDGGYVLIDTGYEQDWESFKQQIHSNEIDFSQISHIVLTHHHDDHCALLHNILHENSAIKVVMSRDCGKLLLKGENDRTHGGGCINRRVAFLLRYKQLYLSLKTGKKMEKKNNLKFSPYQTRDCDILVEGTTTLRAIGISLDGKILETPGHTVDSLSVLFDDGTCLAGDAAADMLKFAGTKNCVIFINDLNEYYKSWEKLIAAGAKTIYPAHGKPFPSERLKQNMRKNKSKNIVPLSTSIESR